MTLRLIIVQVEDFLVYRIHKNTNKWKDPRYSKKGSVQSIYAIACEGYQGTDRWKTKCFTASMNAIVSLWNCDQASSTIPLKVPIVYILCKPRNFNKDNVSIWWDSQETISLRSKFKDWNLRETLGSAVIFWMFDTCSERLWEKGYKYLKNRLENGCSFDFSYDIRLQLEQASTVTWIQYLLWSSFSEKRESMFPFDFFTKQTLEAFAQTDAGV